VAQGNPNLSKFVELIGAAGLTNSVSSTTEALTIFAPTNAAFDALGADTLAALERDPAALAKVCLS
jgi:uncharacterized surface protein with fasciclin (FAS1) repeats